MTTTNHTSTKLIATLLILFTLTGMAAATVSENSAPSNIATGTSSVSHSWQLSGKVDAEGSYDIFNISVSAVTSNGATLNTGSYEVTTTDSDTTVKSFSYDSSNNVITANISDGGTADSGDVIFTVTPNYDLAEGVTPESGLNYTVDQYDTSSSTSTSGSATSTSFDMTDGEKPDISETSLQDVTDNDGVVKQGEKVQVSAKVTDEASFNSINADLSNFDGGQTSVTLTTENSAGFDWDGDGSQESNVYGANITVANDGTEGTGQGATITAEDSNTNSKTTSSFGSITVDLTAPSISSATTASTTSIDVTLSEATSGINLSTLDASDFQAVNGSTTITVSSLSNKPSDGATNPSLTLNLATAFETGETPDVKIVSNIEDEAGNAVSSATHTGTNDGVAPVKKSIEYLDTGTDGKIDRIDVTYSETLASGAEAGDYTVGGTDSSVVSSVDSASVNGDTVEISVTAGTVDTAPALTLDYTATGAGGAKVTDDASTSNQAADFSGASISDSAAPSFKSVTTKDADKNGKVDELTTVFSEPIQDGSVEAADLSIGTADGLAGSVNAVSGNSDGDDKVTVEISEGSLTDTGATPTLSYTATGGSSSKIQDTNNNQMSDQTSNAATDGAAPVLMYAEIDHSNSNDLNTITSMVFSESITTSGEATTTTGTKLQFSGSESGSTLTGDYSGSGTDKVLQTGDTPEVDGFNSVADSNANNAVLYQGSNVEIDTFRKTLNSGWNFVSFPIAGTSTPSLSNYFGDTSKVKAVWMYDDGTWKSWTPETSDQDDFSKIRGGVGYQVEIASGKSLTLAPNVNNVKTTQGFAQVQLEEGYNLVGQLEEFNQDASSSGAFASIGSSLGSVYKQSSGFQVTEITGDNKAVKTGSAYWIQTVGDLSDGTVAYTAN